MRVGTKLKVAQGAALILALAATGCGKMKPNGQRDPEKERAEAKRQKAACASSAGYDRLKGLIFDAAIERHAGDHANLDMLADYSVARMEDPVVEGFDATLDITRCKGRFILEIPPGAERAFAGERRLQADIDYSAQMAADGNGLVYKMKGAEPIVARLAAFNLTSGGFRPPAAIDDNPAPEGAGEPAMAQADTAPPPLAPATYRPAPLPEPKPPTPSRREAPTSQAVQPTSSPSEAAAGSDGAATVKAFYGALGAGNGTLASAQVIPEKRSSRAYSADGITRFYGGLREPIRLTDVQPIARGAYRVRYRYSAGRSRCDGSAIVSLADRDGRTLIRSIRALNGC